MSQVTIYLDDKTAKKIKKTSKAEGISLSKWFKKLIHKEFDETWPEEVKRLAGAWRDEDFPTLKEIRSGYGQDVPREKL